MEINKLLDYLYNLKSLGTKFGLETITNLLNTLNNPQQKFKTIHVAGTNGKGSTSAILASILEEAGFKTGLYASPHLVNFNERIQINGQKISNLEIIKLTELIKNEADKVNLNPTFFEFTTTMAFYYFAQNNVDFAIIEVGCGGRLDATNVLESLVSVITPIGKDHTHWLGDTLLKIAKEKAGIIKENGLVVTSEKNKTVLNLFKSICNERKAELFIVNDLISNFTHTNNSGSCPIGKQIFTTSGIIKDEFKIKLLGEHQINNALTAILTIKKLEKRGIKIPLQIIKKGLEKARWPGRLEVIHNKPLVIVDGAHNIAGFRALKMFLTNLFLSDFLKNKKILVLGFSKDKEISKMISMIVPFFDQIIITQGNFKPADVFLIRKKVLKYNQNVSCLPSVKDALKEVASLAGNDDFILITGSLYLVGDILKYRTYFSKLFK